MELMRAIWLYFDYFQIETLFWFWVLALSIILSYLLRISKPSGLYYFILYLSFPLR